MSGVTKPAWRHHALASSWDEDHAPAGGTWLDGPSVEKRYPRFERYDLGAVLASPRAVNDAARRSTRSFDDARGLTLAEVRGALNGICAAGPSRPYASAGALYGSEAYLYPVRVERLESGTLMHLLPSQLQLERMWPVPTLAERAFPSQRWIGFAPLIVIVTSRIGLYVGKYGERGYRFALQEVGALTHQLASSARAHGLDSCIVGGYRDAVLAEGLGLRPDGDEQPLACVLIGHEHHS